MFSHVIPAPTISAGGDQDLHLDMYGIHMEWGRYFFSILVLFLSVRLMQSAHFKQTSYKFL